MGGGGAHFRPGSAERDESRAVMRSSSSLDRKRNYPVSDFNRSADAFPDAQNGDVPGEMLLIIAPSPCFPCGSLALKAEVFTASVLVFIASR